MKTILIIIILDLVVILAGLTWMSYEIDRRVEYSKQMKAKCDTDAFNYKGVRPDWCKDY